MKSVSTGLPVDAIVYTTMLTQGGAGHLSRRLVPCGQRLLEPHIWIMWLSAVWFCNSWLLAKLEPSDSFSIGCLPPKLEMPGEKLGHLASALECP